MSDEITVMFLYSGLCYSHLARGAILPHQSSVMSAGALLPAGACRCGGDKGARAVWGPVEWVPEASVNASLAGAALRSALVIPGNTPAIPTPSAGLHSTCREQLSFCLLVLKYPLSSAVSHNVIVSQGESGGVLTSHAHRSLVLM